MLEPKVELIGILSKISLGIAILLFIKLQCNDKAFTVDPLGVKFELTVMEAVVTDGYVPGENPKSGAIEPVEAKSMLGVLATVGNPEPPALQYPDGGSEYPAYGPEVTVVGTKENTIWF